MEQEPAEFRDVEIGEILEIRYNHTHTMNVHIVFTIISIHLPIAVFDLVSAYSGNKCYQTAMYGNIYIDMEHYLMVSGYVWIIICSYYISVYFRYGTYLDYTIAFIGDFIQLMGIYVLLFWNILALLLIIQMSNPTIVPNCNLKIIEYLYLTISIKSLSGILFIVCYQCCRQGQHRIFVEED
jgi:hypothetical protein